MHTAKAIAGFEVSVSGRDDGTLEAAYVRLKHGKVKRTKEVIEDILMVDYDDKGKLLGIEILAPVPLKMLTKQVDQPRRSSFRKFVQHWVPRDLIRA